MPDVECFVGYAVCGCLLLPSHFTCLNGNRSHVLMNMFQRHVSFAKIEVRWNHGLTYEETRQAVCTKQWFSPFSKLFCTQKCHIHLARHGDSLPDQLTVKAYPPRRGKTWVGGRGGELDEGAGAEETRIGWMLQQVGGVSCPWWDMAVEEAICLWWFHHVRFHMFHWVLVLQWFEEPLISFRWWVEKWGFKDGPPSFSVNSIDAEHHEAQLMSKHIRCFLYRQPTVMRLPGLSTRASLTWMVSQGNLDDESWTHGWEIPFKGEDLLLHDVWWISKPSRCSWKSSRPWWQHRDLADLMAFSIGMATVPYLKVYHKEW